METFRFESCVRGHHIYKNIWNPLGEELTCSREVENTQDPFAVAEILNRGKNKSSHMRMWLLDTSLVRDDSVQ